MIIPEYARYNFSIEKSCDFLEEYKIISFPVNPFSIISQNKWCILKYTDLATEFNCSIDDVITSLQSKDGFTLYDGINYTIAYNDLKLEKRILFTLMHEIGHIYLNHLIDFEKTKLYRGSLSKSENKILENEANTFARNVLAPTTLVNQLKEKTTKNLTSYFGLSSDAAKTRLALLTVDLKYINYNGIRDRLFNIFYKFHTKKRCATCESTTFIKDIKFCPICGSKKLKWSEGKMTYEKYETKEETNKLIKCPNCSNEETNISGDYCQICGKPLINRCDNRGSNDTYDEKPCGKIVPSNARHCPYCGNKTTFINNEVIEDWEKEYNSSYKNKDRFMNIPDGIDDIDEELPFN